LIDGHNSTILIAINVMLSPPCSAIGKQPRSAHFLTVGLGDTLDLVLLLDGVAVGRALGGVDDLVGEALGNGLDGPERSLTSTGGEQVDGEVHTAEGRHIDSLTTHHTGSTDTGRVLTRTTVDDGVDHHLDRVLVGEQVDDLEGVLDNAHGEKLLAVVAAVHHQGAREALDDGALSLAEAHLAPATSRMREVLNARKIMVKVFQKS